MLPNPNNGNFTIVQSVKDEAPITIEIWNAIGVKVYKEKVSFIDDRIQVKSNNLLSGNYVIRLNKNGVTQSVIKFTVLE